MDASDGCTARGMVTSSLLLFRHRLFLPNNTVILIIIVIGIEQPTDCNPRLQFFFIFRKKFNHVSVLHVVHHGIMPFSVWWGAKFIPGKSYWSADLPCCCLNRSLAHGHPPLRFIERIPDLDWMHKEHDFAAYRSKPSSSWIFRLLRCAVYAWREFITRTWGLRGVESRTFLQK